MRLKISHTTTYAYDRPVDYALLQLRLTPRGGVAGQNVLSWSTRYEGASLQVAYEDHFRNAVEMVQMDDGSQSVSIHCSGEIETEDRTGVVGPGCGLAPLWLYRQPTKATTAGPVIRKLAAGAKDTLAENALSGVHDLSDRVAEAVSYAKGTTHVATSAEEAASAGQGVCQDHAQILISAARHLACRRATSRATCCCRTGSTRRPPTAGPRSGWRGWDGSASTSPTPSAPMIATCVWPSVATIPRRPRCTGCARAAPRKSFAFPCRFSNRVTLPDSSRACYRSFDAR